MLRKTTFWENSEMNTGDRAKHRSNASENFDLKGMVHMITMLTYIAQIYMGEYKNPLKCPETTPCYPVLASFCTLIISVRSQKVMPDYPKNVG